jgi:tellurite resistance protein TehA-like permease
MLTLFMLAVLVGQLRYLPACCPFRISWWAVSFPLAAAASADLRYAAAEPGRIADGIALFCFWPSQHWSLSGCLRERCLESGAESCEL